MIELTGPPRERCGPGDCGLDMEVLLNGTEWNPGRWRVVPPEIPGWSPPDPFVIVVAPGKLTTFHEEYERA
ncbi:MAG TPA: hypothetical protein VJ868_09355 [Actinomycetota bacterium]|nr:hypothetical protein [Actinomycetota bacterium]